MTDASPCITVKLPKIDIMSTPEPDVSSEPIRVRRGRLSDRGMLARLAVYYLAAEPYRYGVLQRELEAYYETGDNLPDRLRRINRDAGADALRAKRHCLSLEKLLAVGRNSELLGPRRADAISVDITEPGKPIVEVHEIKAARRDLVNELHQPAESAVWIQRAHRFWLTVADAGPV